MFNIQGVPRNMSVARRLERRLFIFNVFVTSRQPTFTCMILETKTKEFFYSMSAFFCAIPQKIKNLVQISI